MLVLYTQRKEYLIFFLGISRERDSPTKISFLQFSYKQRPRLETKRSLKKKRPICNLITKKRHYPSQFNCSLFGLHILPFWQKGNGTTVMERRDSDGHRREICLSLVYTLHCPIHIEIHMNGLNSYDSWDWCRFKFSRTNLKADTITPQLNVQCLG